MNILGLNGSLGWDGRIEYVKDQDFWVHGSGATLFIDGELIGSISEERLSRVKHDGRYPKSATNKLLKSGNLTKNDIDIVAWVSNATLMSHHLKIQGYFTERLKENFPNAKIYFVDHHLAHAAGTFLASGFSESNVFTFDGAGDFCLMSDGIEPKVLLNNSSFYSFNFSDKKITCHNKTCTYSGDNMFGGAYTELGEYIYKLKTDNIEYIDTESVDYKTNRRKKLLNLISADSEVDVTNFNGIDTEQLFKGGLEREKYAGKIMGLASYGDYKNIKCDDLFYLSFKKEKVYGNGEEYPVICTNFHIKDYISNNEHDYSPEDLAAWLQYNFEHYLLSLLKNIPEDIKSKKICLSGGCALNIIANSKIIEEGVYDDVFVPTAPNDDGLNFGSAILCAWKFEEKLSLPHNIGCIGMEYDINDFIGGLNEYE